MVMADFVFLTSTKRQKVRAELYSFVNVAFEPDKETQKEFAERIM